MWVLAGGMAGGIIRTFTPSWFPKNTSSSTPYLSIFVLHVIYLACDRSATKNTARYMGEGSGKEWLRGKAKGHCDTRNDKGAHNSSCQHVTIRVVEDKVASEENKPVVFVHAVQYGSRLVMQMRVTVSVEFAAPWPRIFSTRSQLLSSQLCDSQNCFPFQN